MLCSFIPSRSFSITAVTRSNVFAFLFGNNQLRVPVGADNRKLQDLFLLALFPSSFDGGLGEPELLSRKVGAELEFSEEEEEEEEEDPRTEEEGEEEEEEEEDPRTDGEGEEEEEEEEGPFSVELISL